MKLEELLNSLIEKGWKPTNRAQRGDVYKCEVRGLPGWINVRFFIKGEEYGNYGMNLRELVAKDTGLWQFVCENGLWKDIDEEKYWHKKTPKMSELRSYDYHFKEYRIIQSALTDESELEDFLLQNINVDAI